MKYISTIGALSTVCLALGGCLSTDSGPGEPRVEFSAEKYVSSEADSAALITVVRTGDVSKAASVGYSTSPGSATPGADYQPQSGVLTWEPGDATEKTFEIPLLADSELERRETVVLNLGGVDGVALGDADKAVLEIRDNECAGLLSDNVSDRRELEAGCYLVTNDIFVANGGQLILDPGVTLIFEASARLEIDQGGSLTAVGSPEQRIVLTGAEKTPGYWQGVSFVGADSQDNRLSWVTIEYGGASAESANLVVRGNSEKRARVRVDNAILAQGGGYGFIFRDSADIDDFSVITSTGNATGAGRMPMSYAPLLDAANSSFFGNKRDYLDLTPETLDEDQTWPAINAAYGMASGAHTLHAALTLQPGVTLAFDRDARLLVEGDGVLNAIGAADSRIVFTAQEQTPGYWAGIEIAGSNDDVASNFQYVDISYGGGAGSLANLNLSGAAEGLALASITDSTITNSAGLGIRVGPDNAFIQQSGNFFADNQGGDIN